MIARCLGYENDRFTRVYNENIGLSNEEAINANLVATAIISFMEKRALCSGTCKQILSELNQLVQTTPGVSWISKNKDWPKSATSFSNMLNEIIPNLGQIGIVVDRKYDKHTKSDKITIVNNNYEPPHDDK